MVPLVLNERTMSIILCNSRIKLTCLARSKPSSRSQLVGEQSNRLSIMQDRGRKSRHRRIKKQDRYERLAATSQLSLR